MAINPNFWQTVNEYTVKKKKSVHKNVIIIPRSQQSECSRVSLSCIVRIALQSLVKPLSHAQRTRTL